ncbi:hypothetical protein Mapa_008022 [Marchantia paleacea]|nr:hypothetical protein Mapa_008022 [Marchantia paleacea]
MSLLFSSYCCMNALHEVAAAAGASMPLSLSPSLLTMPEYSLLACGPFLLSFLQWQNVLALLRESD